jgi:hypothetical protein
MSFFTFRERQVIRIGYEEWVFQAVTIEPIRTELKRLSPNKLDRPHFFHFFIRDAI